jgi:5-methylthioadenosine/S-adenosylhomocysteine deaminase
MSADLSLPPQASTPVPDLIVAGDHVLTMDEARTVLVDAAVLVADGTILGVVDRAEAARRHPGVPTLGGPGAVVTPGFVNAHQHLTGDRLIRSSIPDDLPAGEAIFSWAVPVHAAHTADDDELSATLACVEAVTHGVTTTIEAGTVAHPARVATGMAAVGMRGTVGTWGWDVEDGPFAAPAPEVLERQAAVLDELPPGGLVTGWVTLVGHDLMSDELVSGASALALARGTGLTFHLSPSVSDVTAYLARTGRRPLVHLDSLGALGPHVLVAHAVHLDDAEVDVLLRSGTAVAACPWAYLRLGQGVTGAGRHAELVRRGGRVALGCDSENAGDLVDPLRAAALFAGLAKDTRVDPTWFGAHDALELLTVRGAEAVGLGGLVGTIEPGRRADLVVHGRGPAWIPPGHDPVLQLVWASDGRAVRDVVIDGRVVVRDGRCTTVDAEALRDEAVAAGRRLLERAGIVARPRWPLVRPSDHC